MAGLAGSGVQKRLGTEPVSGQTPERKCFGFGLVR
jgi:hypothetical protein